jgi:hypothetical protein
MCGTLSLTDRANKQLNFANIVVVAPAISRALNVTGFANDSVALNCKYAAHGNGIGMSSSLRSCPTSVCVWIVSELFVFVEQLEAPITCFHFGGVANIGAGKAYLVAQ